MRQKLGIGGRIRGGGGTSFSSIRVFLLFAVMVFAFGRFVTLAPLIHSGTGRSIAGVSSTDASSRSTSIRLNSKLSGDSARTQTESDMGSQGQMGSLSGGHEKPLLRQEDLEEREKLDQLEYAEPGEHPKVALMFLVRGSVGNEPVWRAFLEGAAKLRLKAHAVKPQPVDLETVAGGPLHPPVQSLEEARYPGYKIQHGLVPPSKYRKTKYPHVRKRSLLQKEGDDVIQEEDEEVSRKDEGSMQESAEDAAQRNNASCLLEKSNLASEAGRLLKSAEDGPALYKRQDLFSVYIHAQPGFTFPPDSIFSGRQVADPVNCTNAFALHILVLAEFKLFEMALEDERNQKFVLLSEACVPVQPPEVVYAQSIYEQKSRIHACVSRDPGRLELWRWKEKMKTSHLKQQHWRKSQQWFMLNRAHAELVVADHHVKEVFKRYCWSYGKHICVSDEHYIPTLLASYNLDDQTDCLGEGTWTDWSVHGWHPKTFTGDDISTDLFQRILNGGWPPCDPVVARRTALELFDFDDTHQGTASMSRECGEVVMGKRFERDFSRGALDDLPSNDWISRSGYLPLGYECPLFARKFDPDAVASTLNATLSCNGGALGYWCKESLMSSIPFIGNSEVP